MAIRVLAPCTESEKWVFWKDLSGFMGKAKKACATFLLFTKSVWKKKRILKKQDHS